MMVYDIGINPDRAWRLTILDIHVLMKRFKDDERRKNYRAAMIVAAIFNVNRNPKKQKNPYTPEEILGEKKEKKDNDMLQTAKSLTKLFGGEVTI
jgi:hypothetical protein